MFWAKGIQARHKAKQGDFRRTGSKNRFKRVLGVLEGEHFTAVCFQGAWCGTTKGQSGAKICLTWDSQVRNQGRGEATRVLLF